METSSKREPAPDEVCILVYVADLLSSGLTYILFKLD